MPSHSRFARRGTCRSNIACTFLSISIFSREGSYRGCTVDTRVVLVGMRLSSRSRSAFTRAIRMMSRETRGNGKVADDQLLQYQDDVADERAW